MKKTITLWDAHTANIINTLSGIDSDKSRICFTTDNKQIVGGT
jgi:hypothetical protein